MSGATQKRVSNGSGGRTHLAALQLGFNGIAAQLQVGHLARHGREVGLEGREIAREGREKLGAGLRCELGVEVDVLGQATHVDVLL